MHTGRLRSIGVGLALMALLAAAPAATAFAGLKAPRLTKSVTVMDFAFTPKSVTIARGSSIKWTNQGPSTHTTTSNSGLWDKTLPPGQSFTRRFTSVGRFPYHCSIHPFMKGVITVTSS